MRVGHSLERDIRNSRSGAVVPRVRFHETVRLGSQVKASPSRWLMIGFAFSATTINYLDRQTLSVAAPILHVQFHMSNTVSLRSFEAGVW